jgi:hypothetical protein
VPSACARFAMTRLDARRASALDRARGTIGDFYDGENLRARATEDARARAGVARRTVVMVDGRMMMGRDVSRG